MDTLTVGHAVAGLLIYMTIQTILSFRHDHIFYRTMKGISEWMAQMESRMGELERRSR